MQLKRGITLIFPTLDESQNPFIKESLNNLKEFKLQNGSFPFEVIISSGTENLNFETPQELKDQIKVISSHKDSRSLRLKDGFDHAQTDIVILHHPRSVIDLESLKFLLNQKDITWGGLTHQFDWTTPLLKFTSWYSNEVRLKLRNIIYLDHCFVVNKSKIKQNFFPPDEIFEDTIISNNLYDQLGVPSLYPYASRTSSIRFQKNGLWFQSLLNQFLKVAFMIGLSHKTMNKIYEKGLELNSKFKNVN